MKTKVYLAGYSGETEYRKYVKRMWGDVLTAFDPMTEVDAEIVAKAKNRSLTKEEVANIVISDKEEIESSNYLVAYVERFSAGTMMEIMYAWQEGIPVYVISTKESMRKDVWIDYHTTKSFKTIDECFEEILAEIVDKATNSWNRNI